MAIGAREPGRRHQLDFGLRVRSLRLERDQSQERLAELAGLHRNYVGGVERGEINLSLGNVYAIARGLNVDVVALFDAPEEHSGRTSDGRRRAARRRSAASSD